MKNPRPRASSGRRRAGPTAVALVTSVVGLALAVACGTEKPLLTGPSGPPDPNATFTRVQREIFTPSCAIAGPGGCHAGPSPQLGLSLEAGRSYGLLVGAPSNEVLRLLVAPGDPEASYLVSKVRGDASIIGSRMPLGGPFLSAEKERLLVDWIRRGALND